MNKPPPNLTPHPATAEAILRTERGGCCGGCEAAETPVHVAGIVAGDDTIHQRGHRLSEREWVLSWMNNYQKCAVKGRRELYSPKPFHLLWSTLQGSSEEVGVGGERGVWERGGRGLVEINRFFSGRGWGGNSSSSSHWKKGKVRKRIKSASEGAAKPVRQCLCCHRVVLYTHEMSPRACVARTPLVDEELMFQLEGYSETSSMWWGATSTSLSLFLPHMLFWTHFWIETAL